MCSSDLGLLLLTYAMNTAMLVGYAVLHGAAWGLRGPFMQAIRADYFGRSAIGMILGLAPLYADGLVRDGLVQVDELTGSSGAGKKPAATQHFSHLNDNVVPYRVLNHQHVVEAEMTLGRMGPGTGATVDFIPHLLGTTRGILNTMHVTLAQIGRAHV